MQPPVVSGVPPIPPIPGFAAPAPYGSSHPVFGQPWEGTPRGSPWGDVSNDRSVPGAWPGNSNNNNNNEGEGGYREREDNNDQSHQASQAKYKAAEALEAKVVQKEEELMEMHERMALEDQAFALAELDRGGGGEKGNHGSDEKNTAAGSGGARTNSYMVKARRLEEELIALSESLERLRTEADEEYAKELGAEEVRRGGY
ncbi:hypothetical protein B0T17DRAFT_517555 [Bombardia bombarda]|uniref:Uncharacterized protein n=1 Tax=Bombardia bombarda TaxID=252184 RepID=A0AA39XKU9_9PEZI|nr:hypothetical protein B0T17DRAFT_517555 [Bombardia bombarda]